MEQGLAEESSPYLLALDQSEAWSRLGLGATLQRLDRGRCVLRLPASAAVRDGRLVNTVSSGAVAWLVEMAGAACSCSALRKGQVSNGTADVDLSYLRPAVGDSVVATAVLRRMGKSLACVTVDVESQPAGKLVATGKLLYSVAEGGEADAAAALGGYGGGGADGAVRVLSLGGDEGADEAAASAAGSPPLVVVAAAVALMAGALQMVLRKR